MDDKRYSLNDIFAILNEATQILTKDVTVVSEGSEGSESSEGSEGSKNQIKTRMRLNEYIAMVVADELVKPDSRLASSDFTSSKNDVVKAMKANYYEDVAFPNYNYHGVILGGYRKKAKTLKKK